MGDREKGDTVVMGKQEGKISHNVDGRIMPYTR
jgi:hypothetical protein